MLLTGEGRSHIRVFHAPITIQARLHRAFTFASPLTPIMDTNAFYIEIYPENRKRFRPV